MCPVGIVCRVISNMTLTIVSIVIVVVVVAGNTCTDGFVNILCIAVVVHCVCALIALFVTSALGNLIAAFYCKL